MSTSGRRSSAGARRGTDLGLRASAAAGLLLSAHLPLGLAPGHASTGGQITMGAQAVAAALVGSVYVAVPAVGSFSPFADPIRYAEEVVAVLSVAVTLLCALAGSALGAGARGPLARSGALRA